MAARRRAGSFSPKTSRRLRISKVDMLYGMACLLSASSAACDVSTRNGSFVCLKLRYEAAFHILRWLTTIFVATADGRLDGRDKRRAVTALMKARIISAGDLESYPGRTNRVRITGHPELTEGLISISGSIADNSRAATRWVAHNIEGVHLCYG